MPDYPLSGVRVVDLTHYIAGPYCTKLFADLGADVIKIEKPDRGDGARWLRPFIGDEPHPEKSALFLYLNTNKRSVILDLKTKEGIDTVKEMARKADILVENFRPGVMAQLGISYPVLERINPRLVMTSISNFGSEGPYRDWKATELTLNALSGMMFMTGEADREPVKLALSQVQYSAGVAAAIATLAAHRYQRLTGYGQHIDVSTLEPFFNMLHQQTGRYAYQGAVQERGLIEKFPWIFQTKDGWVHASRLQVVLLAAYISQSVPELKSFEAMNPMALNGNWRALGDAMKPWFTARTRMEATNELQLQGINASPVYNEADLISSPQLSARDFFIQVEHPVAGRGTYPGRYFLCDQIPIKPAQPAPLFGQHTNEVLNELKQTGTNTAASSKVVSEEPSHDPRTLPLEGIRILSVEHWAALPHATKYLASLGAEIIVVESPARQQGDPKQRVAEFTGGLYAESHRAKLGITIDLSKPEGVELFKRLVMISDAVVDNFTPRVMKNLGIDYESLRKVRPDVITLSISGYGRRGPWRLYRGYSITAEATSGLANLTGYADSTAVRPGGTPPGDIIPALHSTFALLAALEYRRRTGKGADIDISMTEPITCQLGEAIVNYSLTGRAGARMGNRDANIAPSGCYPCAGEDSWVTIAVYDQAQWKALVKLMGSPAWAKGRKYNTAKARLERQDEIDGHISSWTRNQDKMEVMRLCQQAGIPAGAVLHIRELFTNEQNLYRGSFEVVNLPPPPVGPGHRVHLSPPWRLSRTASNTIRPPRIELGVDNDYVFRNLLGLKDNELVALEAKGVISTTPTVEPPDMSAVRSLQMTREENYLDVIGLR
ncbi:MAG: CoA transferase [Dehalococcoidia bacterium]|nr:CoA transferase [Dehalococcoidia bacterium]